MSTKLNRHGYEQLIAGDLEWLRAQPKTLERDHVIQIVEDSVRTYYEVEPHVSTLATALAVAESHLRKELWYGHGCFPPALYGDDGEMSCNACVIDFKREPIESLVSRVTSIRSRRILEMRAQAQQEPPQRRLVFCKHCSKTHSVTPSEKECAPGAWTAE